MYSRTQYAGLLLITLLLSGLIISATTLSVSKQNVAFAANANDSWAIYTDPRFDFSLKYPSDWSLIPRNDSRGVGATLTFSKSDPYHVGNHADPHDTVPKIQIGMYLIPWSEEQSMKDWADQYNELGEVPGVDEINITRTQYIIVNGLDAL